MDLRSAVRIVRRHWIIVAITLASTALVTVVLTQRIEPEYEADGSVLLSASPNLPTVEGETQPRNPLENPGSVGVAANSVKQKLESPSLAQELETEGVTAYSVSIPPEGSGALLSLSAQGDTPSAALEGYDRLLDAAREELVAIQYERGIPADLWIDAAPLTSPTDASALNGSRMRILAGVVLLGTVSAFTFAFLADSLRGRGRLRPRWPWRRGKEGEEDEDGDEPVVGYIAGSGEPARPRPVKDRDGGRRTG